MTDNIQRIHDIDIKILKEFIGICEKYKLEYSVIDGTMLGMVRHSGFIPWDDDVDIAMPRSSYEKFVHVVEKELPENMYIEHFNLEKKKNDKDLSYITRLFCSDVKVKLNINELVPVQGVWIDIMQMDGMPKSKIRFLIHKYKLLFLKAITKMTQPETIGMHINNRPLFDRMLIWVSKHVGFFKKINTQKRYRKLDQALKKYEVCKENDVCIFISDYRFKEMVPYDFYFPLKKYKFEDLEVMGPNQPEKILEQLYGDYMKLPPVEERNKHNLTIVE